MIQKRIYFLLGLVLGSLLTLLVLRGSLERLAAYVQAERRSDEFDEAFDAWFDGLERRNRSGDVYPGMFRDEEV